MATPMFLAVPSMTFIADSMLEQLRSGNFVFAISSSCERLIVPAWPKEDCPEPLSIPAAFVIKTDAGGVWL